MKMMYLMYIILLLVIIRRKLLLLSSLFLRKMKVHHSVHSILQLNSVMVMLTQQFLLLHLFLTCSWRSIHLVNHIISLLVLSMVRLVLLVLLVLTITILKKNFMLWSHLVFNEQCNRNNMVHLLILTKQLSKLLYLLFLKLISVNLLFTYKMRLRRFFKITNGSSIIQQLVMLS